MRIARAHVLTRRPADATSVLQILETILTKTPPSVRVLHIAANLLPLRQVARISQDPFAPLGLCIDKQLATAYRELAPTDPGRYGPDFIDTLNNIGVRYHQQGQPDEALKWCKEAVHLGREFTRTHPAVCEVRLAMALRNLSFLLRGKGRQNDSDALATAEEILAIERRFIAAHPNGDTSYLALTLYDTARHLSRAGRPEESVTALDESATLYRRLAQTEPAYEPSLARVLTALSIELEDLGHFDQARAPANESADIRDRRGLPFSPDPVAGLRRRKTRI
nr:tetratricopeptide repeat protein [Streptomyces sp. SID8354]